MLQLSFSNFNCKGFKYRNFEYISELYKSSDVMLLQEHWLRNFEFKEFNNVLDDCSFVAKSPMLDSEVILGRPYSGVAILWKSYLNAYVETIPTMSTKLVAIKVAIGEFNLIALSVYMPCNNVVLMKNLLIFYRKL